MTDNSQSDKPSSSKTPTVSFSTANHPKHWDAGEYGIRVDKPQLLFNNPGNLYLRLE